MSNFDPYTYAQQNGFIHAELNPDGSVTITVTKSKHQQLVAAVSEAIDETFAEIIASTTYINDITHDEDYQSVEIIVDRAGYENAIDLTSFTVMYGVAMYHAYAGTNYNLQIRIIDETGAVLESFG